MLSAVIQYFRTLIGSASIPSDVLTILAFVLCSFIVGAIFTAFSRKAATEWWFASRVVVIVLAVLAVADELALTLSVGGVA